MAGNKFSYTIFFFLSSCLSLTISLPLSTDSRWIVDENGHRVKLACVSWASHIDVVVAEGLNKQPVDVISNKISSMGFNCVRLTWPIYLATNDTISNTTVRKSFESLVLNEAISGFQANNPSIIDLTLMQAFQTVVGSLTKNKVMVIIDNHISKPGWCCSNSDGNGFFGDKYFDPDLWIKGLTNMATLFKDNPNVVGMSLRNELRVPIQNDWYKYMQQGLTIMATLFLYNPIVVGMSLRNELRGPKQNVNDWYKYMQQGAEAVHAANPNVLVILSGLSFDTDLSFLHQRQINLTFSKKTVFEVHRYSFSESSVWANNNPNEACGQVMNDMKSRAGYLLDQGYSLFVSEWGLDQRGSNVNDNRYLNCFMGWFAEFDLDWSLWTLAGSYYVREGSIGPEATYGVLTYNWNEIRNSSILARISSIQAPFQGPGISDAKPHKLIFHPLTGLCVQRKSLLDPLILGPCTDSDAWDYTQQKELKIKGTLFCLESDQITKPAKLGIMCSGSTAKWDTISSSKMHISSMVNDGKKTTACLDVNLTSNVIVTNTCKCLDRNKKCDPASQWFKIIDSTRKTHAANW